MLVTTYCDCPFAKHGFSVAVLPMLAIVLVNQLHTTLVTTIKVLKVAA